MKTGWILTPGPTEISKIYTNAVKQARNRGILHHRHPEYKKIEEKVHSLLLVLFGAPKGQARLFRGGGRSMMWAVVGNFYRAGEKILLINNGKFGDEWKEILLEFNADFVEARSEWGKKFDEKEVERICRNEKISLALMQLGETSTGIRNDCARASQIIKRHLPDAILAIDAVLEGGVSKINMEREGIDIVLGGVQKAFMMPPGLAYVVFGERALGRLDENEKAAFPVGEWNFRKKMAFTPPVEQVVGLHAMLSYILKNRGEVRWYKDHKQRAKFIRRRLLKMGFTLFPKENDRYLTNAVSLFVVPHGWSALNIQEKLRQRGWIVETGLGPLKDRVLRVAHFGGIPFARLKHFCKDLKEIINNH